MKTSNIYNNYFSGFSDFCNFNKNDNKTNMLALLKILSYFTVVIPLIFGTLYGINSLSGRISKKEIPSKQEQTIDRIGLETLGVTENKLSEVLSVYDEHFLPKQNRENLYHYSKSADFQRHAKSGRIYYNSTQLSESDALRIIFQREPTNIAMGKGQYNKDGLKALLGYEVGVYNDKDAKKTDKSFFKDLPNTATVYSETYLWNPPGGSNKIEIACLSLPAPALDSKKQPHYTYYMVEGKLDAAKYEEEIKFLFQCIEKVVRDNKDTAFDNKGIKRVVLPRFGQGAFLSSLNSKDKRVANQAFKNQLNSFIKKISDMSVKVVLSEFSEPAEKWHDAIIIGDILQQAQEHDLIINAWDPHSAPGNGNDNDASFDGAMGKGTGILLTQTAWLNETLRSKDSLVPLIGK